jgi:hypothetical protein
MSTSLAGCVLATLPWLGFYASLYFISRLWAKNAFSFLRNSSSSNLSYWGASVCSLANTLILTPMAWRASSESGFFATDVSFRISTPLSTACHHALLGYTTWDLVLLVFYRKEWPSFRAYFLHHASVLLGWGICAVNGLAHNASVPMQLLESTGLFVNARYFLSEAGLKESRWYFYNGVAMLTSFFLVRIVFNVWLIATRLWTQRETISAELPTWIWLTLMSLQVINLAIQHMWFWKILKGCIAVARGTPQSNSKEA